METGNVYRDIERVLRRIDEIKRSFREKEVYYNKKFKEIYRERVRNIESEVRRKNSVSGKGIGDKKNGKGEHTSSKALDSGVKNTEKSKSVKNHGCRIDSGESLNLNGEKNGNNGIKEKLKEDIIYEAARRFGLPESLIRAIIKQESNFNERAVSRKGAMGLMQLMPETADLLGVKNPFDIKENIFGGTRYLRDLLELYGGNLNMALAAYNAGPSRVKEGIPDIKETKSFVDSVIEFYKKYSKYEDIR